MFEQITQPTVSTALCDRYENVTHHLLPDDRSVPRMPSRTILIPMRKEAGFALSQLPKDESISQLIHGADTNPNLRVRKDAFFLLDQSQDPMPWRISKKCLRDNELRRPPLPWSMKYIRSMSNSP
jgi:HEAT repeat protein